MRFGGRLTARWEARYRARRASMVARCVAGAVAAAVAVGALAGPAAAGDAAPAEGLYAVVERPDGTVEVVRGAEALEVAWDSALDRTATEVLALDTEEPVAALGGDPLRWQQWALDRTSYEATWPSTTGGVTVAVVDTGVRGDHEDLAGAVVPGIDYISGGDGRTDPNGHGTHVAGIIAARVGNGRGLAGGAPAARVMPVRVLDANGSGVSSNVAAGIIWAVDRGARVVNLSLGGGADAGTHAAVRYAVAKGALVVAAAGNTDGAVIYPAAYGEAVAVGAVESSLRRASFSNHGPEIDLVAPGDGIVSTWGSSSSAYAAASGTSMATPYVAAAAALVFAAKPSLSVAQARAALESSADDLGPGGRDDEYGRGLVDPRGAVNQALVPPGGSKGRGYWVVDGDGEVHALGGATHYGQPAGLPGMQPIVASAVTPTGRGYWLVARNGAVYAYGDARALGGLDHLPLNAPIVGMAPTPSGRGYFLLGRDGGVFAFGDAEFHGSTGGMALNSPVLDMTIGPRGGYWFVAADGGIFSFGDARFLGSTGGMHLVAPVMSMTAKSAGDGYWMIGLDGGVFAFGRAPFHGSLPGLRASGMSLPAALRMRALPDGSGYYVLGHDGSVFAFGQARFHGSAMGDAVDLMLVP